MEWELWKADYFVSLPGPERGDLNAANTIAALQAACGRRPNPPRVYVPFEPQRAVEKPQQTEGEAKREMAAVARKWPGATVTVKKKEERR